MMKKIEMRRKYSAAEIEDLMTNSFSSDTNSDDESKQNFETLPGNSTDEVSFEILRNVESMLTY